MDKQKKQNILTAIIIVLVIALFIMIGSILYEEKINMSKQPIQNTNAPVINNEVEQDVIEENNDEITENDNTNVEDEQNEDKSDEVISEEDNTEYVGEEENNVEEKTEMTTDEKVIDLVKKEWGNDETVTFSIEKKNGSKYRVAVRDGSTTVLQWYEVNIETWKVSEY